MRGERIKLQSTTKSEPSSARQQNAIEMAFRWWAGDGPTLSAGLVALWFSRYPDQYSGMRKFRIDQDFLIEHWHMIYIMPVVFAEIYFWMKLNSILDIN